MVALDQPGEKKKQGHDSASPPENHHGQGTSHAAVVPHCLLRGPSLRGAKDVSAAQGNGGGQQEHAQGGQQLFFEMPPGLQKGSMKNRIEQKNANQQRGEFSEFQKHSPLSWLPRTTPVQGDTQ